MRAAARMPIVHSANYVFYRLFKRDRSAQISCTFSGTAEHACSEPYHGSLACAELVRGHRAPESHPDRRGLT